MEMWEGAVGWVGGEDLGTELFPTRKAPGSQEPPVRGPEITQVNNRQRPANIQHAASHGGWGGVQAAQLLPSGPVTAGLWQWELWEVLCRWELSSLVSHHVATVFDQLS